LPDKHKQVSLPLGDGRQTDLDWDCWEACRARIDGGVGTGKGWGCCKTNWKAACIQDQVSLPGCWGANNKGFPGVAVGGVIVVECVFSIIWGASHLTG
jgi:hypothetical protein